MKHLLLCAVWAIIGYAVTAQTLRNDIDSTLSLLMTQDVDERMATYYSFADRNRFSDYDSTMTVLLQYEKDAELNHRTHDADLARRMQYVLTMNTEKVDKAMEMLDVFIEKCDKDESHDIYVYFVSQKNYTLIDNGLIQTAFVKVKELLESTPQDDSPMLAMLYYNLGRIYQCSANDSMSVACLSKAIELCQQGGDYNLICEVYFQLCDALQQGKQYDEVLVRTADWMQAINTAEKEGYPQFNARLRRVLCLFMKSFAYYNFGDAENLHSTYLQMKQLANNGTDLPYSIAQIEIFDLILGKKYDEALIAVDQIIDYFSKHAPVTNTLWFKVKAELQYILGMPEAYLTMVENDELTSDIINETSASQLNEFSTIYEVEQVKAHAAQLRSRLLIAFVAAVLLLMLAAVIMFYNRRLKQHIRMLCERIDSMSKPQAKVASDTSNDDKPSGGKPSIAKNELFSEVERVLSDSKVLTSEIDRDELAKMVGTNRTYLATCIHESTGLSLSDYINTKRLGKAIEMLKENAEMKITDISEAVGFASYTTFYRIFSKQYGVSPVDYRNYLLEKHESATA